MGVVLVGTTSIDALHFLDKNSNSKRVVLRFGGVCNNVSCALGNLDLKPRFVTVSYSGELGIAVSLHFKKNNVEWCPLPVFAPLPFFQAGIKSKGLVVNEQFIGGEALSLLTPENIRKHINVFSKAKIICSCTDLPLSSLKELQKIASENKSEFWLLSSSKEEVSKFLKLTLTPQCIGLNINELETLLGKKLNTNSEIAKATLHLVSSGGVCLITLGENGSILCVNNSYESFYIYQPVPRILGKSTIGAGDVLFACLLAEYLHGKTWEIALESATSSVLSFISNNNSAPLYFNLRDSKFKLPTKIRVTI